MSQKKWANVSEHQKTTNKKHPNLIKKTVVSSTPVESSILNQLLLKLLCWSSHTVPGDEGRGHIALNTAAIFHVHFQVMQSWKNWLK